MPFDMNMALEAAKDTGNRERFNQTVSSPIGDITVSTPKRVLEQKPQEVIEKEWQDFIFRDDIMAMPEAREIESSGLKENWSATLNQFLLEDTSYSRWIPTLWEGNIMREVQSLNEQGIITDEEIDYFDSFFGMDVAGLAYYLRYERGMEQFPTYSEMEELHREEFKNFRESAEEVYSRASWTGKLGQGLGTIHGYMIDPVTSISLFTGWGSAASWLAIAANVARISAIEAGVETLRQPFVYTWKQEIGADYNAGDVINNILMAGASAGALTAGAQVTVLGARKILEKWMEIAPNPGIRAALHSLQKATDPGEPVSDFVKRDEAWNRRMNERGGWESPDPADATRSDEAAQTRFEEATAFADDYPDMVVFETLDSGDVVSTTVGKVREAAEKTKELLQTIKEACLGKM